MGGSVLPATSPGFSAAASGCPASWALPGRGVGEVTAPGGKRRAPRLVSVSLLVKRVQSSEAPAGGAVPRVHTPGAKLIPALPAAKPGSQSPQHPPQTAWGEVHSRQTLCRSQCPGTNTCKHSTLLPPGKGVCTVPGHRDVSVAGEEARE